QTVKIPRFFPGVHIAALFNHSKVVCSHGAVAASQLQLQPSPARIRIRIRAQIRVRIQDETKKETKVHGSRSCVLKLQLVFEPEPGQPEN
ncbi:hypothetical protein M5D96_002275, partial [Drosophila gunungcola]